MQKGKKRVHRLVVLPDYQGIGIGTTFIKEIAKIISERGYELNLTTTTPALVGALRKDSEWILGRYGRAGNMRNWDRLKGCETKQLGNSNSSKRITYSFWYKSAKKI